MLAVRDKSHTNASGLFSATTTTATVTNTTTDVTTRYTAAAVVFVTISG